jgi:hypothetical protein
VGLLQRNYLSFCEWRGTSPSVFIQSRQENAIKLARLGSHLGTTPDRLNIHEIMLHGIANRVGVEEQPMHGVDASKLLHGLVCIEHGAIGVIEAMSLDRMPP